MLFRKGEFYSNFLAINILCFDSFQSKKTMKGEPGVNPSKQFTHEDSLKKYLIAYSYKSLSVLYNFDILPGPEMSICSKLF